MLTPFNQLESRARDWNVTVDEIKETTGSVIGFGRRFDASVVLKITKHEGDETKAGKVLRAFAGNPVVEVIE